MYVYSHADSCIYVMYSWKQIKLHNTKLVKYLEKKEKKLILIVIQTVTIVRLGLLSAHVLS